jgi:hypothetical protein
MYKFYVHAHYKKGEPDIPFYIGKGQRRRAYSKNKRTAEWRAVVEECGYDVRILAEHLSQKDSLWLESYLIGMFGRADLGKGPLVNRTDGGQGGPVGRIPWNKNKRGIYRQDTLQKIREGQLGRKHTKEEKDARSIRMTGIGNPMFGHFHTKETKENIGAKKRGISLPPRSIKWRNKISNALVGRTFTKEHKNNLRNASINAWKRKKMVQLPLDILNNTKYITDTIIQKAINIPAVPTPTGEVL